MFLVAFTSVNAQELDMMAKLPNDAEVRTGTLDNGATYYIRKNSKDPQRANFHILYKVGAILEEDRQDGLAHFLEHMAFNGSDSFQGNGLIEYCRSIGVEFGTNLNAATGQEATTYMITGVPIVREGIIDSMLLVLHDWAGFISLEEEAIDDERGVIQEEWRMYAAMADQRVRKESIKLLFGEESIYNRRDIIGEYSNLEAFTYQDIRDFYHTWYRPELQAFVIVGDFDPDVMEQKLKDVMSNVPASETPAVLPAVEKLPDNAEPRFGVFTDPELKETSITLNCRLAPTNKKYNNTVMAMKTDLLNNMGTWMLNRRFSDIAKSADTKFQQAYVYTGSYFKPFDLFSMGASAREGETYDAFEAAYTELLRAMRGGFVQPELDRIKAEYLASIEQGYNNRNDRKNDSFVKEYKDNFYENTPYLDAETEYQFYKTLIESVSIDEVNAQFETLLTSKNITIEANLQSKEGVELPTVEGLQEIYERVNASEIAPYEEEVITRPLIAEGVVLKGSKVVKEEEGVFGSTIWTLKNGLKVVVKPTDLKADEVLFSAQRQGGTSLTGELAELYAAQSLNSFNNISGISDFSDTEITRVLSGKNVSIAPYIGSETEGYSGSSSNADVETLLQLLYLYSTAPRFAEEDFATYLDKVRTQINGHASDPMFAFQKAVTETLYPNDPRQLNSMTEEYISQVTLEGMEAEYHKHFDNNSGFVFQFTGSMDLETLKPLVEKYIGSLPVQKTKKQPAYGEYHSDITTGKIVNHFETPQAEARVIFFGLASGDLKDGSIAEMVNLKVAGQVLDNVYMRTIREDKGGVYTISNSINSSNTGRDQKFMNQCFFLTDTSKYEELIPLVYSGLETMLTEGPAKEDVETSVKALKKQYDNALLMNRYWHNQIGEYYTWDVDNHTGYAEALDAITVESVKDAANAAFGQGNMVELVQLP